MDFFNKFAPTTECIAAHENGDETNNYKHTHVFVQWKKQVDTTNERCFDIYDEETKEHLHPHIKSIGRKKEDKEALMRYLAKEDEENKYLLTLYPKDKPCLALRVWKCDTIQEVAMMAKNPCDIPGLLQLAQIKAQTACIPKLPTLYLHKKWQNQLWREVLELDEPWDRRAVRWIVGEVGGEGKSLFIEVLKSNFRHDVLVVTQFAGQSNIAEVINTALQKGWTGNILAVDLPRDAENHQIYEPLEAIMNGTITATKYKGSELTLPTRPKVFVMANFMPNETKMSRDRWWISSIVSSSMGGLLVMQTVVNPERNSRLRSELRSKGTTNNYDWGFTDTIVNPLSATNNITNVALNNMSDSQSVIHTIIHTEDPLPPLKKRKMSLDCETVDDLLEYFE